MLILVLGVKGVGKSTVLAPVEDQLKTAGVKCSRVNYGDVMLEVAKAHGVQNREQLSEVPINQFDAFQLEAAKKIGAMAKGKHAVFLDTHGFIYAQAERILLPGMPNRIADHVNPGLVVLMEADPGVIYERRKKDNDSGKRVRVQNTVAEIALNQDAERQSALYVSMRFGVGVKVVDRTKPIEQDASQIPELANAIQKALTRQK